MRTIHLNGVSINSNKTRTACGERVDGTEVESYRDSTCYYCRLNWEKAQWVRNASK